MGNTIGFPACPRGNSMHVKLVMTIFGGTAPLDLTGMTLAFIANQKLDGKTAPSVFVQWSLHTNPAGGLTEFDIPDSLTSTLVPGSYYINITGRNPTGDVQTFVAGTWAITPVPGLISGAA